MAELRGSGPPSLTPGVLLTLRCVGDDLVITRSSETHEVNIGLKSVSLPHLQAEEFGQQLRDPRPAFGGRWNGRRAALPPNVKW
jgi:hypothetical protein